MFVQCFYMSLLLPSKILVCLKQASIYIDKNEIRGTIDSILWNAAYSKRGKSEEVEDQILARYQLW